MKFFASIFFLLILFSCDNSGSSSNETVDCSMGKPQAIFDEKNPQISSQSFSLNKSSSLEMVEFSNGLKLELTQSGCEFVKQQFQFSFEENTTDFPKEFWIERAIQKFRFLAKLDEKYQPFMLWASFIHNKKEQFNLNIPLELEPGHFATINKISSQNESHLIVILESK